MYNKFTKSKMSIKQEIFLLRVLLPVIGRIHTHQIMNLSRLRYNRFGKNNYRNLQCRWLRSPISCYFPNHGIKFPDHQYTIILRLSSSSNEEEEGKGPHSAVFIKTFKTKHSKYFKAGIKTLSHNTAAQIRGSSV